MRWPWQKETPKKIETPPVCNHKYKDFPWYMESVYYESEGRITAKVTEPFVCLLCKKRKDVTLMRYDSYEHNREVADKWLAEEIEEFKDRLVSRALVEDMIADMQLVDHEFLKYYEMIHNTENSIPKIELPKDPERVSVDQLSQWILAKNGIEPYASHFRNVRGDEVHTITPLTKEEIG